MPFKYFTIMKKGENVIDYSFPLVKEAFNDFLAKKIILLLKMPVLSSKESTIGDILELNLENDLSSNAIIKFEQIIKVDSIWNLEKEKNKILLDNKNPVLILQKEGNAKYIDCAILYNNEILILFQCKKALKKKSDNFINKSKLEKNKMKLYNNFIMKLEVTLKKIYLFYVTGITFYKENNEIKYKTWGVNENENFNEIEKLANKSNAELLYYDILQKKLYSKSMNSDEFLKVDEFINYVNLFEPILIDGKTEKKNTIQLREKLYENLLLTS